MSSPLLEIWEAASASPYQTTVSKNSQFAVGFILLLLGKSKLFQLLEARLTTCCSFHSHWHLWAKYINVVTIY